MSSFNSQIYTDVIVVRATVITSVFPSIGVQLKRHEYSSPPAISQVLTSSPSRIHLQHNTQSATRSSGTSSGNGPLKPSSRLFAVLMPLCQGFQVRVNPQASCPGAKSSNPLGLVSMEQLSYLTIADPFALLHALDGDMHSETNSAATSSALFRY